MTPAPEYASAHAAVANAHGESFAHRAATLAHDLNNVFTPIIGYTQVVRDDLAAGDSASYDVAQMLLDLDAVIAATVRGIELSKELLRLASEHALQDAKSSLSVPAHVQDHPSPAPQ